MVKDYRNAFVEKAVRSALETIDKILSDELKIDLPQPNIRHALDHLSKAKKANSVNLATLFLLFYLLENPSWNRQDIPVGIRGKYGDKLLAEELNIRNITLHNNITAFGENLGWKGNVREFDLSKDTRFAFITSLNVQPECEIKKAAHYFAYLFAKTQVVIPPLPDVGQDVLTFARAKNLLHELVKTPSEGHIQQFLVASLLSVHRNRYGYDIKTHHPHASDKYDVSAGDIEEFYENNITRAYEVTVRNDWENRISNFKYKMDKFGLSKYVIIASGVTNNPIWGESASMLKQLEPYGRDIAVIDILEFVNVFASELSSNELKQVVNKGYEYLRNNRLCGRADIIRDYKSKLCLKNRRAMARQGKNRRKSGVYREVNEPFEPIFNAVWASAGIFQTKRKVDLWLDSVHRTPYE